MKKFISFVLAILIVFGVFSVDSFGKENFLLIASALDYIEIPGSSIKWRYDASSKTLVVGGTGAIPDYVLKYEENKEGTSDGYYTTAPWWPFFDRAENIVIEKGVTTIGQRSFYTFTKVKNIELPDSLEYINNCAFHCCSSVERLILPEKLKKIGENAFDGCISLLSITIPGTVTSIEYAAFHWCLELKYVKIKNGCKTIGKSAFNNCISLESVFIPSSVTSIGKYAFCREKSLNGYWAYSGYDNFCVYGISQSYAESFARNNDIPFIEFNGGDLKYPVYVKTDFAKYLEFLISNSDCSSVFDEFTSVYSFEDMLDMTIDVPLMLENNIACTIENENITVGILLAYILFSEQAQYFVDENIRNVERKIKQGKEETAYTDFLKAVKEFECMFHYFQTQGSFSGEDTFYKGLLSLVLANTAINSIPIDGVKKTYKNIAKTYKVQVTESPEYYEDLKYYVLSGGDDSYLNSGYKDALDKYEILYKNTKKVGKIYLKLDTEDDSIIDGSIVELALENLSYFAEKNNSEYSETIKSIKEGYDVADTAIDLIKTINSFSLFGILTNSFKLTNKYIEEVKKVYDKFQDKESGWYALAYYYLSSNNPRLLKTMFDEETGSAAFFYERLIKYGFPVDEDDVIEKSLAVYYETKSKYEYMYSPNEDIRMYLWNSCDTMNQISNIDCFEYKNMLLKYLIAKMNAENGDVGVDICLSVYANDNSLGTTTGAGEYEFGSTATLCATPYENVSFSGWINEKTGETISTDETLTYEVYNNENIIAVFIPGDFQTAKKPQVLSYSKSVSYYQGQFPESLSVSACTEDEGEITVSWYENSKNSNANGTYVGDGLNCVPLTDQKGVKYYYAVVKNTLTSNVGTKTESSVAVTITPTIKVEVLNPIVVGVNLKSTPIKREYFCYENLDTNGMVVELIYSNNVKKTTELYQVDYDFSSVGTKLVEIITPYGNMFFDCLIQNIFAQDNTIIDYDNRIIFSNNFLNKDYNDFIIFSDSVTVVPSNQYYYMGTGAVVNVSVGNNTETYRIIVNGDLNGDSVCNVVDVTDVERIINNHREATIEEIYAANGGVADRITVADYQNIVNKALTS